MQWKNEGLKTHDSQNCDSGYRPDISCKLMSNIRVANLSFFILRSTMAGRTLVETTVVFCLTTSTDKVFKYDGLSDVL